MTPIEKRFWAYTYERRWTNSTTLRRRNFFGHIVSMQQSGSHWVKNMLSGVLASLYQLPSMKHIQDDSIIGHPKSLPIYKNIPQIVHSHSYPHGLTLCVPFLHYPRYLVLVRDLRTSLISHYERFKGDYNNVDFDTYLRGDVNQKLYHSDIYSRIRFMNEWGRMLARYPQKTTQLRYEDMQTDPQQALKKVCEFFDVPGVTDALVGRIVEENTQTKMAEKPKNPLVTTTVIRTEHKPMEFYFTQENSIFFEETCAKLLLHDFGYGYPVNRQRAA